VLDDNILLDSLNGYQFEEVVADIFRKNGFRNVIVTPCSNDGGKDIVMEKKDPNGELIKIVVECKHHQSKIGRPVVQKLHSAVVTLNHVGKKQGYVVTSSSFSPNAVQYAQEINNSLENIEIRLIDGRELKELAIGAKVDLKNGIIEAYSNESTYYSPKEKTINWTLENFFYPVNAISKMDLVVQNIRTVFHPVFYIEYNISANFSTTVGIIHNERANGQLFFDGERGNLLDYNLAGLLINDSNINFKTLPENQFSSKIDFRLNESELKELAMNEIIISHTRNIRYKGKNNVQYIKECIPKAKDITISNYKCLYYPKWEINIQAKRNDYNIYFVETPSDNIVTKNETDFCRVCNSNITKKIIFRSKWYCKECGSITCKGHVKVTRMTNASICIDCAVMKRFFGAKKYFESTEELRDFESYYSALPRHKKVMENSYLLFTTVVFSFIFIFMVAL
jgi:restriction system protein